MTRRYRQGLVLVEDYSSSTTTAMAERLKSVLQVLNKDTVGRAWARHMQARNLYYTQWVMYGTQTAVTSKCTQVHNTGAESTESEADAHMVLRASNTDPEDPKDSMTAIPKSLVIFSSAFCVGTYVFTAQLYFSHHFPSHSFMLMPPTNEKGLLNTSHTHCNLHSCSRLTHTHTKLP